MHHDFNPEVFICFWLWFLYLLNLAFFLDHSWWHQVEFLEIFCDFFWHRQTFIRSMSNNFYTIQNAKEWALTTGRYQEGMVK